MLKDILTPHPYAACYPLLHSSLAELLKDSILHNGLRQPIVLWKDDSRQMTWIVDGRNRYRALLEIQGGVRKEQVIWQDYTDDESVRLAVLDYNENRRQMTTAQKSLVAGRLLKTQMSLLAEQEEQEEQVVHPQSEESDVALAPEAEEIQIAEEEAETSSKEEAEIPPSPPSENMTSVQKIIREEPAKARKEVASTLGIGTLTAKKGSAIVRRGVDELVDAVEQGQISIEAAYTLTELEDEDIQEIVQQDKKVIREKVREIKNNRNEKKESEKQSLANQSSFEIRSAQWIQKVSIEYSNEDDESQSTYHMSDLNPEQKEQLYKVLFAFYSDQND